MISFLHDRCKAGMCEDCISIAEEYQELEERLKCDLVNMEQELEEAKKAATAATRKAQMYEQVAKAGIPEIISAWLDNNIKELL